MAAVDADGPNTVIPDDRTEPRRQRLSPDERQVLAYGVVGLAESTSRHWLRIGLGPGADADAFADTVAQLAWSGLRGINP